MAVQQPVASFPLQGPVMTGCSTPSGGVEEVAAVLVDLVTVVVWVYSTPGRREDVVVLVMVVGPVGALGALVVLFEHQ